ncbi:MAG: nucleotidyltransferase family protein [Mariprofundales bacterium]|nr:nucleotidyltransferase family protein [Mariprofundales bacterium]
MSNTEHFHRSCFACLLRGDPEFDHALLETAAFWRQARMEGVLALLWHQLVSKNIQLSPAIQLQIRDALREQTIELGIIRHAANQALTTLDRAGIRVIMLRGLALAETLYPRASLRPQSDIDLLLNPVQMQPALIALGAIGFAPINSWQPHLLVRGDALIDLHDEPLGGDRIQAWRQLTPLSGNTFFAQAHHDGNTLRIPDSLQIPWLCFHATKHSFERLIWLNDIALLANQISQNQTWDQAITTIHQLRLEHPCYFSLSYCVEQFNAEVPDEVLAAIRPAMDWRERALLQRHLTHEQIPFLAERLFARMLPRLRQRLAFWYETIIPRHEVREQIAAGGCVKCTFIRTRLRQLGLAISMLHLEWRGWRLLFCKH